MVKAKGDTRTGDLFSAGQYFPVRQPSTLPTSLDLKRAFATAMGEAVRTSGKTVPVIAAEMSEILVDDEVTTAQLYAYTSESRTSHTISIVRWIAFVRATGCDWLWDFILRNEGLIVLKGEEALHAEASLLERQGHELLRRAKQAREAAPLEVQFRKPRGR
ncbi:hypothetical protein [Phenylobacterium ferrooxidans]|uniref:Uncharacterized protein n=1 Tax=Phenylobacterium ferrooxidans TaxID=2982689 RepID=A0ABW6CNF1_9CAUL